MQPKLWNSPAFLMTVATLFLGVNFWVILPSFTANQGDTAGNALYIGSRVLTFLLLALGISLRAGTPRMRSMTALAAVAFVDQVLFKVLYFWIDHRANPQNWVGYDLNGHFMATLVSYILFCPVILLLGSGASLLGNWIVRKWGALPTA
jgi:hypothetical protein